MNTPWGKSDYSDRVMPGIVYYSTSSHGGYKVSKKLNDTISIKWKLSGRFEGWYEEDCGWAPLAAIFPKFFPSYSTDDISATIPSWERWVNRLERRS